MSRQTPALEYHSRGRPGKLEIAATKPFITQRDLSLAYSPGVAEPCVEIHGDPNEVYAYTAKGNLVAVISNGTAVLGLGNIGPLAAKPVMEGKAILFKRFADIDVFDVELDVSDREALVEVVRALGPTYGGINLEDIAAPDCFYIEQKLQELLDIPVFHDDQHGTAIISAAALINALELQDKKLDEVTVVMNGAGAAGIATARLYVSLGVPRENIILCDSRGVIWKGRGSGMNEFKAEFASDTEARSLADALRGADVFVGCSVADVVTKEMVRSMADRPIIFALANPDPEISYPDACDARDDLIMATGRSDFPNQVNNVLGFPFLFRGALDVRARAINDEMKIAAVNALARLARERVPEAVLSAYGLQALSFGPDYIIPKPFDHRVALWVAPAVAQAAVDSGVARLPFPGLEAYRAQLEQRLGGSRQLTRPLRERARRQEVKQRIVLTEGHHPRILRAAAYLVDEQLCAPILMGSRRRIRTRMVELGLTDLYDRVEIVDLIEQEELQERYAHLLWERRRRKGLTLTDARRAMTQATDFGLMMVQEGQADGLVAGETTHYTKVVRPALQIIGAHEGEHAVGVYLLQRKERILFLADCTMTLEPTAEQLATIAERTAELAKRLGVTPKVALLSYSNFGDSAHPRARVVARARQLLEEREVDFSFDGEMQADMAVNAALRTESFPFSGLDGAANVLVFPNLESANIAYKLLGTVGGMDTVGPILLGLNKPVNVLQMGARVSNIVTMAVVTAHEASGGSL